MRYWFSAWWLLTGCFLQAQDTSVNRFLGGIELNVHSAAGLGTSKPACSFEGKPLIKKVSVWFTGIGLFGQDTLAVCDNLFGSTTSWCEGPASLAGNARLQKKEWPGVWQVDKSDVLLHRKNYTKPGYLAPQGIAQWPGSFVNAGYPVLLAPYADASLDGSYNAMDGDFPYVPGEVNLWSMASDSAGKASFFTKGVNVDLSSLWFNLSSEDTIIRNTAMNRLTLCNRSGSDIQQARLSLAVDFAIGDASDDYMATDVVNKSLIAMNADGADAVFGSDPPAAAVGWLSAKVAGSMRFEQGNDAVQGAPEKAAHFFNLAAAKWKTGNPLGFGGRGLDATGRTARFIYPGNTDANSPRSWSEAGEGNNPGRRTGLISTDSFTLKGGQCKVFDAFVAVLKAPATDGNISKSLKKVQDVYAVQNFTLFAQASQKEKNNPVYPNPASRNEPVFFNLKPMSKVGIWDSKGSYTEMLSGSMGELRFDKPGVYRIATLGGHAAVVVVY